MFLVTSGTVDNAGEVIANVAAGIFADVECSSHRGLFVTTVVIADDVIVDAQCF